MMMTTMNTMSVIMIIISHRSFKPLARKDHALLVKEQFLRAAIDDDDDDNDNNREQKNDK